MSQNKIYENLRYEGFGPFNTALIIETLTDNKNRSASSIRTVLQKNGGRLGETGSTTHMFFNCGVIHIEKSKISEEQAFETTINSGAMDYLKTNEYYEILTKKEDFYKIKLELEKKIGEFAYSAIEWRALNYLNLNKEQSKKMIDLLSALEEIDDVQNIFTNSKIES
tara:strand:+ start:27 stop:527 length:501 start_codon:yes stop_codon:yes gene_type:complete